MTLRMTRSLNQLKALALFAERVSHSLRTPLGVVSGAASDLVQGYTLNKQDLEDANRASLQIKDQLSWIAQLAAVPKESNKVSVNLKTSLANLSTTEQFGAVEILFAEKEDEEIIIITDQAVLKAALTGLIGSLASVQTMGGSEQNRTEQSRPEQSRPEQGRTEQGRTEKPKIIASIKVSRSLSSSGITVELDCYSPHIDLTKWNLPSPIRAQDIVQHIHSLESLGLLYFQEAIEALGGAAKFEATNLGKLLIKASLPILK